MTWYCVERHGLPLETGRYHVYFKGVVDWLRYDTEFGWFWQDGSEMGAVTQQYVLWWKEYTKPPVGKIDHDDAFEHPRRNSLSQKQKQFIAYAEDRSREYLEEYLEKVDLQERECVCINKKTLASSNGKCAQCGAKNIPDDNLRVWGGTFDGTDRLIVAARTKKEAAERLCISYYILNKYGDESWNERELKIANSNPGIVFKEVRKSMPNPRDSYTYYERAYE